MTPRLQVYLSGGESIVCLRYNVFGAYSQAASKQDIRDALGTEYREGERTWAETVRLQERLVALAPEIVTAANITVPRWGSLNVEHWERIQDAMPAKALAEQILPHGTWVSQECRPYETLATWAVVSGVLGLRVNVDNRDDRHESRTLRLDAPYISWEFFAGPQASSQLLLRIDEYLKKRSPRATRNKEVTMALASLRDILRPSMREKMWDHPLLDRVLPSIVGTTGQGVHKTFFVTKVVEGAPVTAKSRKSLDKALRLLAKKIGVAVDDIPTTP